MSETIFSRILRREIPADIVHEDEDIVGFRDIAAQAPTHVLFIPRKPIATLNDLADDDALLVGKLVLAATRFAKAEGLADEGYRLVVNCNRHGGQSVYHLHLHLLGGRQMAWPPG